MALTLDQVRHVAKLSELELSESELQAMATDLSAILAHVDQLQQLDTQGCSTAPQGNELLSFRIDEPWPCTSHEQALKQAPKPMEDGFAVPAFVED
jgi:aspartyl-tRNA(Asn)/glutamyl-tRNA(Gln) amidotransferase subunit C